MKLLSKEFLKCVTPGQRALGKLHEGVTRNCRWTELGVAQNYSKAFISRFGDT